ncbi:MAG: hypothetical protein H6R16_2319 [Proteobacteria bacterium]|nr:hypothetical protein [Pseudomonadota bacterium]
MKKHSFEAVLFNALLMLELDDQTMLDLLD